MDFTYLPEKTKFVFDTLSETKFIKKYTLVGGTALSMQIKHRMSEDLDFIFDGKFLNIISIKRNIHNSFSHYKIIKEDGNYQIDFAVRNTKVTFFSSGAILIPFNVMNYSEKHKNLNIASAEIIGTLKLAAISHRNTLRDYYDLYFLSKYITSLAKIFENTKKLIPNLSPITYSETLTYIDDLQEDTIAEHLHPKEIINKYELANFFVDELKKIKKRI